MAERHRIGRLFKRFAGYPVQAVFIYFFVYLMRYLPFPVASAIGAFLARLLGPLSRGQKVARRNLLAAFPEKSKAEINRIISGMWDNLGRVAGEWAQVDRIATTGRNARIEVLGSEYLEAAEKSGESFIMYSAHMANWEIALLMAARRGIRMGSIYRSASNPWVDRLILRFRGRFCSELIPKGRAGAKRLLAVLKNNRPLALLVDQKLNEGLAVPFFGRDAMTATAPAELALRLKCRLIPVRLERLPAGHFRVTIYPPMLLPDTGDRQQDTLALLTDMNKLLEGWIRARPEQWFWVHRRWP